MIYMIEEEGRDGEAPSYEELSKHNEFLANALEKEVEEREKEAAKYRAVIARHEKTIASLRREIDNPWVCNWQKK